VYAITDSTSRKLNSAAPTCQSADAPARWTDGEARPPAQIIALQATLAAISAITIAAVGFGAHNRGIVASARAPGVRGHDHFQPNYFPDLVCQLASGKGNIVP